MNTGVNGIEVRGLSKQVPSGGQVLAILDRIDLDVPRGQVLAVVGPSGSGKSTLLGLIAGLDTPTAGSVKIAGTELAGLNEDQLAAVRAAKLGFVFQSYQLLPTFTAEENVALPLELAGGNGGHGGTDARRRARELLQAVGLGDRAHHYPAQLSGGEQQRVAVARAFANRPAVLLADEPTGNLDSKTGAQIIDLLFSLNREQGTTIVLVTHDGHLAERADRVVEMRDGRIVSDRAAASPAANAGSSAGALV